MGGGRGAQGEDRQGRGSPPIELAQDVVEVGEQVGAAGAVVGVRGAVAVAVEAAAGVGEVDGAELVEAVGAQVGELEDVAGLADEGGTDEVLVDPGVLADDQEGRGGGARREAVGEVVGRDADVTGDGMEGAEGAGREGRQDREGTHQGRGGHGRLVGGGMSGQPGISGMGGDEWGGVKAVMASM